jgi:hypothetical protein
MRMKIYIGLTGRYFKKGIKIEIVDGHFTCMYGVVGLNPVQNNAVSLRL